jgi:hypothetical protein
MFDPNWAQVAGTVFLGLVGLWLAHNYRRQIGLQLAERQVDAYVSLWAVIAAAMPMRMTPLDRVERQRMRDEMNRWYFDEGNGILLSTPARDLFVAVQSNLTCPIDLIRPPTLAAELARLSETEAERRRGCVCIRHASLLRTQMKTDLNLHLGLSYYSGLRPADRDFLRSCGLSPWRRPWRGRLWGAGGRVPRRLQTARRFITDLCVCGMCLPDTPPSTPDSE